MFTENLALQIRRTSQYLLMCQQAPCAASCSDLREMCENVPEMCGPNGYASEVPSNFGPPLHVWTSVRLPEVVDPSSMFVFRNFRGFRFLRQNMLMFSRAHLRAVFRRAKVQWGFSEASKGIKRPSVGDTSLAEGLFGNNIRKVPRDWSELCIVVGVSVFAQVA